MSALALSVAITPAGAQKRTLRAADVVVQREQFIREQTGYKHECDGVSIPLPKGTYVVHVRVTERAPAQSSSGRNGEVWARHPDAVNIYARKQAGRTDCKTDECWEPLLTTSIRAAHDDFERPISLDAPTTCLFVFGHSYYARPTTQRHYSCSCEGCWTSRETAIDSREALEFTIRSPAGTTVVTLKKS